MARLYVHGRVMTEYTQEGYVTYRVMQDGKILKNKIGRGWKIAKLKPEFMSNPDLLITRGYTKRVVSSGGVL